MGAVAVVGFDTDVADANGLVPFITADAEERRDSSADGWRDGTIDNRGFDVGMWVFN